MAASDNPRPPAALPPGTRLHEFELRRVLGMGGFGIVYLAFDHALEREVAIKEYMPSSLVGRSSGALLSLLSETHAESFSLGLRSFLNEARLLARFDAPGLVKVHRYWEANNTAYMAMPFYAGSNLHAVRRRMAQPPDEAWLRQLLGPLLDALERLHREGVYHRDISPDNVILQPDGQPVLLDFGAARRVVLTEKSVALTAILKPAYAPIEQYAEAGAVKQGAWTDLYALGATLHFLLLGRAPPPATARAVDDDMRPLASQPDLLARCTPGFLQAIDWMLAPRPAHRPQTVAALREALAPRPVAPANPGGDDSGHIDLDGEDATVLLPRRDERTVLIPRQAAPPAAGDDEPTVLLPRKAMPAAPPAGGDEPTVLLPRKAAPPLAGGDEPTVFVPRPAGPPPAGGDEPTVLLPRRPARAMPAVGGNEPTVLLPRKGEVTVLLPLGDEAAAQAEAPHEATMRLPPAGAGRPPAPARPEALQAHPDDALPRPAPPKSVRPWVAAAGLVAAALVAAWLMLKPAGPAPAATEPPAPALPASAATAATATPTDTGPAPAAPWPADAAASTTGPAAMAKAPASQPAPARPIATKAAPAANDGARTGRTAAPVLPEPEPQAEPTTAANSAPPSLATSITRLPPATEPTLAAATPLAAVAPRAVTEPPRNPGQSAAPTATAALPLAAAAPRGAETPVPRVVHREAEPVLLQARALSPAERCDGRAAAALWTCIDRLCRADTGLREHADCARARRELGAGTH